MGQHVLFYTITYTTLHVTSLPSLRATTLYTPVTTRHYTRHVTTRHVPIRVTTRLYSTSPPSLTVHVTARHYTALHVYILLHVLHRYSLLYIMLWCGWVGTFCLVVERRRCRAACVCVVGVVDDIRPCPQHDATASRPEIEQPNLAPPSARGCRVCSGCPAVREFARSLVRSLVLLRSGIQPCVHPPLHAGRKLT